MSDKRKTKKRITALLLIIILLLTGFGGRGLFLNHQKGRLIQMVKESRSEADVVVLGDSIWDLNRGDQGIADLVGENLSASSRIYNLSIRGSRATEDASDAGSNIQLYDVLSMLETGENRIPSEYEASSELDRLYAETPYVRYAVIAYGLNDYFLGVRMENPVDGFDPKTYAGALRNAVEKIYSLFPGVTIILCGPTYSVGYSNGKIVNEGNTHSCGGGTIPQYNEVARKVAAQYGILFVDNYADLKITKGNSATYLVDGTHLTLKGREKYANNFLYRLAQKELGN